MPVNRSLALITVATILAAAAFIFVLFGFTPQHNAPHTTISSIPPQAFEYTPALAAMTADVRETAIVDTVTHLQGFSTRRFGTAGNVQAAGYLYDRFDAIPNLTVEYQGGRFRNVIATLPGRNASSGLTFIVGAHYDSITDDGDYAPGATDNGCGAAIVLEMARVMSQNPVNHTVVFALWNSEEFDPMGSEAFVEEAAEKSFDIPLYYNYDSACYDPENSLVLDIQSGPESAAIADLMRHDNALYGIGFNLTTDVFDCVSDYQVFRHAGYPGIATHAEQHGPSHTANDTVDAIPPLYAAKNARLGTAVIATLANLP